MASASYFKNPTVTVTDILGAGAASDLCGWVVSSTNAADGFLQIFNAKASTVTTGTTAPNIEVYIPKTGGIQPGIAWLYPGIHSENGWSFAVSTAQGGSAGMTYGNPIDVTFFMN